MTAAAGASASARPAAGDAPGGSAALVWKPYGRLRHGQEEEERGPVGHDVRVR